MGAGALISDRRLYLSADKARVVEESDADAAWLLVIPGGEIAAEEAERLGLSLVDGRVVLPGEKQPVPVAEEKPAEPEAAPAKARRRGK